MWGHNFALRKGSLYMYAVCVFKVNRSLPACLWAQAKNDGQHCYWLQCTQDPSIRTNPKIFFSSLHPRDRQHAGAINSMVLLTSCEARHSKTTNSSPCQGDSIQVKGELPSPGVSKDNCTICAIGGMYLFLEARFLFSFAEIKSISSYDCHKDLAKTQGNPSPKRRNDLWGTQWEQRGKDLYLCKLWKLFYSDWLTL